MLSIPFAGIRMSSGNQSQSLTSTIAKLTPFSTNTGTAAQYGTDKEGDPAIVPDPANDRLKINSPGAYLILAQLTGVGPLTSADLVFQLRKNVAGTMTVQSEFTGEDASGPSIYSLTASLSPVLVAANTCAEQTIAFAGVAATDVPVSIIKPTAQAGLGIAGVRIPSAGNVAVNFVNDTASGITPTASETYTFNVLRAGRLTAFFTGILNVVRSDAPTGSSALGTFADPATTAFDGAGGAPKTLTTLDLAALTIAGTQSFTIEYANLLALRLA